MAVPFPNHEKLMGREPSSGEAAGAMLPTVESGPGMASAHGC